MPALEIKRLRKSYGGVPAVKGVSFSIKKGEFFGFIGPNGAGKTTTIKSIMGLLKYEGSIKVFGHDVVTEYRAARMRIGVSPQEFNFDRFLTCEESLMYTAGYYGIPRAEAKRRALVMLERFNLSEKRKARTDTLSGGMKRRLIIARALIHEPDILILDEPTAGLDVELRRELWGELERINKEGTTIILTSHYIEEVERLCHRIGIISNGKIVEIGEKEAMMANLANEELRVRTKKPIPSRIRDSFDLEADEQGDVTVFHGKGLKRRAHKIITRIGKSVPIIETEMRRESLEQVFVRLTEERT